MKMIYNLGYIGIDIKDLITISFIYILSYKSL